MMVFNAQLDKGAKWVTVGTALLFLVNISFLLPGLTQGRYFLFAGILLLLTSIYLGAYLFGTRRYELTAQHLIIQRPWKNKIFGKADIMRAEVLEEGALNRSMRLFGSGGLFGYYGKFSNPRFGAMTWYATNRAKPVLLHLKDGKKVVITPEETEAFVRTLSLSHQIHQGPILEELN